MKKKIPFKAFSPSFVKQAVATTIATTILSTGFIGDIIPEKSRDSLPFGIFSSGKVEAATLYNDDSPWEFEREDWYSVTGNLYSSYSFDPATNQYSPAGHPESWNTTSGLKAGKVVYSGFGSGVRKFEAISDGDSRYKVYYKRASKNSAQMGPEWEVVYRDARPPSTATLDLKPYLADTAYEYRAYASAPGLTYYHSQWGLGAPNVPTTPQLINEIPHANLVAGIRNDTNETITYYIVKKKKNSNPILNLSTQGNQTLSVGETLTLRGTASDPDGDPLTVEAIIGGVRKTANVSEGNWALSWNESELPAGSYNNFSIVVNDGKGGTHSVPYVGNIVVNKEIRVTGVTLDKSSLTFTGPDATLQKLTAIVNPTNATNKNVIWTSSNTNVVTVDANGNVTPKGVGNATITVTTLDGNKTATANVTVNASVTGVTLDKNILSFSDIGQTQKLTAIVNPTNATNKNVVWSSSDMNVAIVDENGNVTSKAIGTAVVTVKTVDGGKTATANVTVTTPSQQARDKVNNDPSSVTPDDLRNIPLSDVIDGNIDEYRDAFKQYKDDLGRDLTKDDMQKVIDAINAVKAAEAKPTASNINKAIEMVNRLQDGQLKTGLKIRIEALIKSPGNFKATEVNSESVAVTWDESAAGATYVLKRGNTEVYRGTNKNFVDTNLTPNTEYRYTLNTQFNGMESASTQVAVRTKVNPVTNIKTVAADSTSVTIGFDTNKNPDGTEYKIKLKEGSTVRGDSGWITATSKKATNLKPSTTYNVEVVARNADGEESKVTMGTVKTTDLQPIQNLKALPSHDSITLNWDDNQKDVQYVIEKYKDSIRIASFAVDEKKYKDTDVEPGKNYTYKIKVRDTIWGGLSTSTDVSVTADQAPAPAAPSNITASNVTETGFDVSWDAVENAATYYIEIYKNGVRQSITSSQLTKTSITGLAPNTDYEVQIKAMSKYSIKGKAGTAIVKTKTTAPVTNTTVTATVNNKNVDVTWVAVAGANGYYIERYKNGQRELRKFTTSTTYTDTNLADGEYEYKVIVYHSSQGMMEPVSKAVMIGAVPGGTGPGETGSSTISTFNATVNGKDVSLTWNAVNKAEGYYIERYKNGVRELRRFVAGTSYTDSNLSDGNYEYKVTLYGNESVQASKAVTISPQTPPGGTDSTITTFETTVEGKDVSLKWNAVVGANGYYVERYKNGARETRNFVRETSYVDRSVPDGVYEYKVSVYASNGNILAPVSESVTVGNGNKPPEQSNVTSFDANVNGKNVALSWNAVPNVNGYYIERFKNGVREMRQFTTNNTYNDLNVADGSYEYKVTVYAKDGTLLTPVSKNVTVGTETVPGDGGNTPQLPTNVTTFDAVTNGKDVTLTWNEVSNAQGFYVERYKNGVREIRQFVSGTTTSFTDKGVADGSYEYRITLYGQSTPVTTNIMVGQTTTEPEGNTSPTNPGETSITSFDVTVNEKEALLTWNAVENAYGYYVERYNGNTREVRQFVSASATNFTDKLAVDGTYTYKVIVYMPSGMLEPVEKTVTVSTVQTLPEQPETPQSREETPTNPVENDAQDIRKTEPSAPVTSEQSEPSKDTANTSEAETSLTEKDTEDTSETKINAPTASVPDINEK